MSAYPPCLTKKDSNIINAEQIDRSSHAECASPDFKIDNLYIKFQACSQKN